MVLLIAIAMLIVNNLVIIERKQTVLSIDMLTNRHVLSNMFWSCKHMGTKILLTIIQFATEGDKE